MGNVTVSLRAGRGSASRLDIHANLGLMAREMARYAPDLSIRVLGSDGAVTAVFGRPEVDNVELF